MIQVTNSTYDLCASSVLDACTTLDQEPGSFQEFSENLSLCNFSQLLELGVV